MTINVKELIKWANFQCHIKGLVKQEMELRKKIVADIYKDAVDHGQTGLNKNKFSIKLERAGITAKAKQGVNVNIEKDKKEELEDEWDDMPDYIKACFPMKPSFSATVYKTLSKAEKSMVDYYIIETPASPTLEVKLED